MIPTGIYLLKDSNRNTRTMCEIYQWRRPGVFTVNFKQIWYIFLVFLLLTLSK